MQYFKTPLPAVQITEVLKKYSPDPDIDTCVVEIENKKALILSDNDIVSSALMDNKNFKSIKISEIDLITIPVMYNVISISGNKDFFSQYINPHA